MKDMYFTITGCQHYFGSDLLEKDQEVLLIKEPDNEYDHEAIIVKLEGLGKIGYVANSAYSVAGETMSAGRLYDKIANKAKGKVIYVLPHGAICKITEAKESDEDVVQEDYLEENDEE